MLTEDWDGINGVLPRSGLVQGTLFKFNPPPLFLQSFLASAYFKYKE